jgi:hypothetical protein
MSPVRNLTDAQKLDLIIDKLVDSEKRQNAIEKSIVKLKVVTGRHRAILTCYGAVLGSALSAVIATFI